ncbi:MAG: hypothetical protein WC343_06725 [Bacilli bacterium]|jgi:hypothetical protein
MADYQFGESLSLNEILKNKEYYAQLFSEGDKMLEKILLYCFDNKIETYMCCAGHFDEEKPAFFVMNIPYASKKLIYSIVSSLYNAENTIIRLGKKSNKEAIQVDFCSHYGASFFESLYDGITNLKNADNIGPDVIAVVEILNKFMNPSYDLYFEYHGMADKTKCHTWVDHIYDNGEKVTRSLHVLSERFCCHNITDKNYFFDEKELNIYSEKISNQMKLVKTKTFNQ